MLFFRNFINQSLFLYCIYFLIQTTLLCGPGHGVNYRSKSKYLVVNRQPNFPETSKHASGPYEKPLLPNDTRLETIMSTEIVFANSDLEANTRKAIESCRSSLISLAEEVNHHWEQQFRIKVLYGYTPASQAGRHLLHMEGRAFDLKLIPAPQRRRNPKETNDFAHENSHNLQRLAGLAYFRAGFSFVEHRESYKYVHVSCRKEYKPTPTYSRCFPANAYVRDQNNNKILMKDLKVGTKVLTMNENGIPMYSEVIMMMHRQVDNAITDYVRVTTDFGRVLILSSYHMIFTKERKFIFTKDLKLNETVQIFHDRNKTFDIARVAKIDYVSSVGAYAPLLMKGTVVVNDVYTSCYAMFPSHQISHYVFSVWRFMYKYFSKTVISLENDSEYHWYPDIFRNVFNSLPLFPYDF